MEWIMNVGCNIILGVGKCCFIRLHYKCICIQAGKGMGKKDAGHLIRGM